MKYIKNFTVILFTLILFSVCVSATNVSLGDNQYNEIIGGTFNALNLDDTPTGTKSIGTSGFIPLSADLDNDGTKETIVLDGATIRIYEDNDLSIVDTYSTVSTGDFQYAVVHDINEDGFLDIIAIQDDVVSMITYNGSLIYSIGNATLSYGDTATIGCKDGYCLALKSVNQAGGYNVPAYIHAYGFNETDVTEITLDSFSGSNYQAIICQPAINSFELEDYDNDGNDEFIVSYYKYMSTGGANEQVVINYINVFDNLTVDSEQSISHTTGLSANNFASTGKCDNVNTNYANTHITSPSVYNYDGGSSNGLETVIGYMTSYGYYRIMVYTSTGVEIEEYPNLLGISYSADGFRLSNVIRANAFTDTDDVDFCVMGYNTPNNNIGAVNDGVTDLLCASLQTGGDDDEEFFFNTDDYYNTSYRYADTIHAIQEVGDTTDGNNLDEILTPYGVMEFQYNGLLVNELNLLYEISKPDGAIMPSDTDGTGQSDLLVQTATNIYYYDDGFTNSGAEITNLRFNPCYNEIMKNGTQSEVIVEVTDVNGDNVGARVTWYDGLSNEYQSDWSTNVTSGSEITFSMLVNKTVSNGIITIEARDTESPSDIDSETRTFSVALTGVEYGDIICDESVLTDDQGEDVSPTALNTTQTTAIGDKVVEMSGLDNSFRYVIGIVMLLILTFGAFEFLRKQQGVQDANILLIFTGGVAFIGWLGLVMVDLLPSWTVIVGLVFGAVALAFKVYSMLNGKEAGGV